MVLTRKKRISASPAIAPPPPPASKPDSIEEGASAASSDLTSGTQTRASTASASEWAVAMGKTSLTPKQDLAEPTTNDAPAFCPVKEESFDDEGRMKKAFKSQFVTLPSKLSCQQPRQPQGGEPTEARVYTVVEVVDSLDENHQSFHEQFEKGVAHLRQQMEVNITTTP